jgi:hypothetical protein
MPFHYTDVPSIYRAFASRLEDDVLVAEQHCEVLSNIYSKEIDDFGTNKCFIHTKKKEQEQIIKNNNKKSFCCFRLPRKMIPVLDSVDFRQEPLGKSSFPAGKFWKIVRSWM